MTPEQELDALGIGFEYDKKFGTREERAARAKAKVPERGPWVDWSAGGFRERDGVSVNAQNRVAWLVERYGNLRPTGSYAGWANGAIATYKAGRGEWDVIEDGIRGAFAREPEYRPQTLACSKKTADQNSIVKAVAAEWAKRNQPAMVMGRTTDRPVMRV